MTGEKVGNMVKCLNNLMMRTATMRRQSVLASDPTMQEITPMQGWIIAFLYFHRDQVIYQKNLEAEFGIPKSTLATIMKQLDDRGYIQRKSAVHDTRLKQICLTEKGEQIQADFIRIFQIVEQGMCKGIPEEELKAFLLTGAKMRMNLENKMSERKEAEPC